MFSNKWSAPVSGAGTSDGGKVSGGSEAVPERKFLRPGTDALRFGCGFAALGFFRLHVLVISGAVAAALVALFCFEPKGQFFYPTCLFHSVTGLLCPGCGSLRALHQLLHGHVLAAFRLNALLMLGLPALAWYGVDSWQRQHHPEREASKRQSLVLWLFLGLALLFAVLRNLPGPWFAWLRPA